VWITVAALGCAAFGVLGVGVCFLIGKYNALVTLRSRIANEMLQIDFSLRKQMFALRAFEPGETFPLGIGVVFGELEADSHRAASIELSAESVATLKVVESRISSLWREVLRSEPGEKAIDQTSARLFTTMARRAIDENFGDFVRLGHLIAEYNKKLRTVGPRVVAVMAGFVALGVIEDQITSKANGRDDGFFI